jgi:hypothetical protein
MLDEHAEQMRLAVEYYEAWTRAEAADSEQGSSWYSIKLYLSVYYVVQALSPCDDADVDL